MICSRVVAGNYLKTRIRPTKVKNKDLYKYLGWKFTLNFKMSLNKTFGSYF